MKQPGQNSTADRVRMRDGLEAPHTCPDQRVEAAWIDYNGHLNMAFYHVMFDRAVDHVYDTLGIGASYVPRSQVPVSRWKCTSTTSTNWSSTIRFG